MSVIFCRTTFCHELITSFRDVISVPVVLTPLVTAASGVNPDKVYQYQTLPPLTLVLYNGSDYGLNDIDWNWYVNIKSVDTGEVLASNRPISFSTDVNDDPVFQCGWQYDDNAVTGTYQAQVHGLLISEQKPIVFEPITYVVRPRV